MFKQQKVFNFKSIWYESLWTGIIPLLQILPGNVELNTAETFTGWKQVSRARSVFTSGIKIDVFIRSRHLLFNYIFFFFTVKWILLILVYYRTKNLDISWEPRNRLFLNLSLWLAGFQQQERFDACFADCFSHAVASQGSSRNSSVSNVWDPGRVCTCPALALVSQRLLGYANTNTVSL